MFKTKLLFSVAAALTASASLMLAAGPAAARDVTVVASVEDEVPVARVSFADLDLADKGGQRTLRGRVSSAIRSVCAPAYDGVASIRYTQCRTSAWNEARPQMASAVARAGRLAAGTATAQDRALALNGAIRFGAQ
jgi:UrcA family protein